MRILIYGMNYLPEVTGVGKYTSEMGRWLVNAGHEVHVISAPPYYPEWKVFGGYFGGRYQRECVEGVRIWRAPIWVPSIPTGARRVLHLLSFALSSVPLLMRQLSWRPDVVLIVAPALLCAPGAWLVARAGRAKAWIHIQDFEVDAAFQLGLLKGRWCRTVALAVERWLLNRFDRVSSISQRMMELLARKGVDSKKLVFFPNWVDISLVKPLMGPNCIRAELGIPMDAIVALYSGNMGTKQGLELLSDLAHQMSNRADIVLVYCGQGAGRPALQAACQGLPNVRFLSLQPIERLNDLLCMADVHLLPQRADAADLVMPSKLTGMFSSGRPVIAAAVPGTELYSVMDHHGIVVPPDKACAWAEALRVLADKPEMRERMGRAARRYAEQHLADHVVLQRFGHELMSCVSGQGGTWRQSSMSNSAPREAEVSSARNG